MSEDSVVLVARAAEFAARRHVNQRRKGAAAEPYVNHLIEVAMLLATSGASPSVVAAGYLHDTLEDTETEYEEIEGLFGREIAAIVAEVTDDKSLPKEERKRRQAEQVRHKSVGARTLKIADKTSNLRSLAASPPADWGVARAGAYIDWSERVIAGCRGLNPDLERLFDAAVVDARAAIASRG